MLSRRKALGSAAALAGLTGALSLDKVSAAESNAAESNASDSKGGPQAIELAHKMSDAWVRFARTGNPNGPGLPNWPAFNPERQPTMVFDNHCEVQYGPDVKEQAAIVQTT